MYIYSFCVWFHSESVQDEIFYHAIVKNKEGKEDSEFFKFICTWKE